MQDCQLRQDKCKISNCCSRHHFSIQDQHVWSWTHLQIQWFHTQAWNTIRNLFYFIESIDISLNQTPVVGKKSSILLVEPVVPKCTVDQQVSLEHSWGFAHILGAGLNPGTCVYGIWKEFPFPCYEPNINVFICDRGLLSNISAYCPLYTVVPRICRRTKSSLVQARGNFKSVTKQCWPTITLYIRILPRRCWIMEHNFISKFDFVNLNGIVIFHF